MQPDSFNLLKFSRFCKLDGSTERASIGKRNNKPFPILPPARTYNEPIEAPKEFWTQEKLYVNLNPLERRTWEMILRGRTISAVARAEGVSRQAVRERIRGNRKHQGGMIAKNFWVLLWWRLRQDLLIANSHD